MSYNTQYNRQQKSLGIFIVIAFHIILIWALANGLKINFEKPNILFHQTKVIEEKTIPIPLPAPETPNIQSNTHNTIENITIPVIPIATESESTPININSTIETNIPHSITTKPKLNKATKPDYPMTSSRLGEEGVTGLNLLINTEGRVEEVKLVSSSGSTRLDEAAIKHAQRNWSFSPCTEEGKPVKCWFQTKLVWKLEHTLI